MLELNLNCRTRSWCNRELLDVGAGGALHAFCEQNCQKCKCFV